MAGARFVRADLHVHLSPEGAIDPLQDAQEYIQAALDRDIGVLGITDHNSIRNVRSALAAAEGLPLLVLPGIEVSSRDGHLLVFFPPDHLDALEGFATADVLDLGKAQPDGSRRSAHTMLHLLNEAGKRGGMGIVAHVDANEGIQATVERGELAELMSHPVLAGLEFRKLVNLQTWFNNDDSDESRRDAWRARERIDDLRDRGLALVMSSDAHDSSLVGKDGIERPLTRLRVGDITYTAVANALMNNPKARCKVEATLPASYPHVTSATFEGGFLDGVVIDFAQNLNCLIGGRGSGKSTALLAIRAALGAKAATEEDDIDDPSRMPARTTVRFVDRAGTERVAVRVMGDIARDERGLSIELPLADLGQGESGHVASSYRSAPLKMLAYLDSFCQLDHQLDRERGVLDRLKDNAAEVVRTDFRKKDHTDADEERQKLEATIKAAEKGKLEDVAAWALRLATQAALIDRVRGHVDRLLASPATVPLPKLEVLAQETKTDLTQRPIDAFTDPLGKALVALDNQLRVVGAARSVKLGGTATRLETVLTQWDAEYARWEARRNARTAELEAQGFRVQAGALTQMGKRLEVLTKLLAEMAEKRRQHALAVAERRQLLIELREARSLIFERRKATLRLVAKRANESTLGLRLSVGFVHEGIKKEWRDWLGPRFHHRGERLNRLSRAIQPWELAAHIVSGDSSSIQRLIDEEGDRQPFLTDGDLDLISNLGWEQIFELEAMRLEDRPNIVVQDSVQGTKRDFDQLSAGQQRSVLLSLLLCADRSDPLLIDQPEDHLDAPYIATAVVAHLEQAKERRQVIVATHNANLTVLGDAELVVPLYAESGRGAVADAGAVDHPATLRHVCRLLEGGATAYTRRGRRYGFQFRVIPSDL